MIALPSFTPHRLDGISPLDRLPAKGLACESGGGISTLDACVLSIEVEDHISVSISINVLQGILDRSGFSASSTKVDCGRVHRRSIEGSSVVSGVRSQNCHRDLPTARWIDAVGEAARLNVDRHYGRRVGVEGDIVEDEEAGEVVNVGHRGR